VCVGWQRCKVGPTGLGLLCEESGPCVSGGVFGLAGGSVAR
jgi:hypothetical protein